MSATHKEISTTIGALVDSEAALAAMVEIELNARLRYHAVKLLRLVNAETDLGFHDQNKKMFEEWGYDRQPSGAETAMRGPGIIREIKAEHKETFKKKIEDMRAVPVVIKWGPIESPWLDAYPQFLGKHMVALGPLCEMIDPEPASESKSV